MKGVTTITVHPDYRVDAIERDVYGCFLESIHNWVYGGIYNPDHPTADDMGFRGDRTQNVIWRVVQGALSGYDPAEVVISVGAHNSPENTREEIATARRRIVSLVRARAPRAKVTLLGE